MQALGMHTAHRGHMHQLSLSSIESADLDDSMSGTLAAGAGHNASRSVSLEGGTGYQPSSRRRMSGGDLASITGNGSAVSSPARRARRVIRVGNSSGRNNSADLSTSVRRRGADETANAFGLQAVGDLYGTLDVIEARERTVVRVGKLDDLESVELFRQAFEVGLDVLEREAVRFSECDLGLF